MSKRREKARDAAVECCKALRKWVTKEAYKRTPNDFSEEVWPYLDRWMRHETNQCYKDPRPMEQAEAPSNWSASISMTSTRKEARGC